MKTHSWIKRLAGALLSVIIFLGLVAYPSIAGTTVSIPSATKVQAQPKQNQAPALPNIPGDEKWSSQFQLGTDGVVFAAVYAPNGDLYIGGDFHHVAGVHANYLARWTATSNKWSGINGTVNDIVKALLLSNNILYIGGYFTQAGGAPAGAIASYDVNTEAWSSLDGGMAHGVLNPMVRAMALDGSGDMIAGGQFDSAGGVSAQNIAEWNGSSWSALSSGLGSTYDTVSAIAASGSDIYAGGTFTSPAGNIALFHNASWSTLGGGTNGDIRALVISGSNLFVGGNFTKVDNGTINALYIARWSISNNTWATLSSGLDGVVEAITIDSSQLVYVAGSFKKADGNPVNLVAVWNGTSWSKLENGLFGGVATAYSLAIYGTDVMVAGGFSATSDFSASNLARWNTAEQAWFSPGNSVNGTVYSIAISGSDVYFGGYFDSAGGLPVTSIARWNSITNTWYTVGDGVLTGCNGFCMGPTVRAIAVNGNDVYIGGDFTYAGGILVNNIARLNGNTWHAMDSGLTGCTGSNCTVSVYTLLADGDGVVAGGLFNDAGMITVNNIAGWYGSAWHTFTDTGNSNTGTNGTVYTVIFDGGYYIGGDFTTPYTNLAYFDGYDWFNAWNALNGPVQAIASTGTDLYVGGSFTNAGGSGANSIAISRNGSNWQPLGSSPNGPVHSLSLQGTTLYVGGLFWQIGGLGANYVAAWNTLNENWSNLGSGTDQQVYAVTTNSGYIYIGGDFLQAGNKPSDKIGRSGGMQFFLPVTIKAP